METKNETVKRLAIFLGINFVVTYGLHIAYFYKFDYEDSRTQLVLTFTMMIPTLCMLLTRKVTKEGFGDMKWEISLSNKKWIYILIAILVPWGICEISAVLHIIMWPGCYDVTNVSEELKVMPLLVPYAGMINAVLFSIGGFGEEAGWRGYMMPKLEKLFGSIGSVVIGGIIWSFWHLIATLAGHNFGTDYPGYQFWGMLTFTIFCIAENALLTYLTKKSNSIWPAAFSHAMNNTGANILGCYINSDKIPEFIARFGIISMTVTVIVGIFFMIKIKKMGLENNSSIANN